MCFGGLRVCAYPGCCALSRVGRLLAFREVQNLKVSFAWCNYTICYDNKVWSTWILFFYTSMNWMPAVCTKEEFSKSSVSVRNMHVWKSDYVRLAWKVNDRTVDSDHPVVKRPKMLSTWCLPRKSCVQGVQNLPVVVSIGMASIDSCVYRHY